MKHTNLIWALCLITSLTLVSCNNQNPQAEQEPEVETTLVEEQSPVQPPIVGMDVAFQQQSVSASQASSLTFEGGTTVDIPANAFVDANGQAVTGEVDILYRDFTSIGEILTSGIPMCKNTEEGLEYFESAGMLEIRAQADGEEVFLADGKMVDLSMPSALGAEDYDFWLLDDESGDWADAGQTTVQPNTDMDALSTPEPLAPVKPHLLDPERTIFDLDASTISYPELKAFQTLVWQQPKTVEPLTEEEIAIVQSTNWNNMKLERIITDETAYALSIKNGDTKIETSLVPVLDAKNYETALADYEEMAAEYERLLEIKKNQKKLAKQAGDFMRFAQLSSFGIYNWDRLKRPTTISMMAEVKFPGEYKDYNNKVNVYLVNPQDMSVITYSPYNLSYFRYDPLNTKSTLLAVLPDNKLAYYSNKQLNGVNWNYIRNSAKPQHSFDMKLSEQEFTSLEDLDELLASL